VLSSTLKIKNAEVLDKGFYTCEVFGGTTRSGETQQRIKSTAILDVVHDAGLSLDLSGCVLWVFCFIKKVVQGLGLEKTM